MQFHGEMGPQHQAGMLGLGRNLEEGRDAAHARGIGHQVVGGAVADQVAFVATGKIEELSPPADLFGTPKSALCVRFLSRVMRY
jgi:ABC-type histidine transport system ATPase subunit